FLHRDFQSRNIIIQDSPPGSRQVRIIDFQGGRLGPPGYDLASLLIDPYVGLSSAEQAALFEGYLDLAAGRGVVDEKSFRQDYPVLALFRNLQMLGAFAYLSRVKGRPGFAWHIPAALASLRSLVARPQFDACSALRELTGRLASEGGGP
ncbi:MAG: phosphotransferase, partial [Deltaproteobacteria bacterium]|nr:phosphotransferase [Deltaproteobacteria bacterium]